MNRPDLPPADRANPGPRRLYAKPRLRLCGHVAELTRGSTGSVRDGRQPTPKPRT